MASGKEIRSKIASVKNTQKITRAMEMVAASKMRKAQDRMRASRPYADKIRNVIRHLAQAHQEYQHPYLTSREAKKVGFIIVSSDRGLCGGLNTNLFRTLLRTMREWDEKGVPVELCIIGQKANAFFRRFGGSIAAQATHLGDSPHVEDLIGTVKVMLDNYQEGNVDRLYLAFNEFVNTMTQRPEIEQLLPIDANVGKTDEKLEHRWDYLYEPEAKEVLDQVLIRYIESLVYQGVVENIACEQAARMVAMKAASDNAGGFIDDLQLAYNKARQAAITQELSEIVGGAAAL
ncbi:F0F1 ATP synthase subunit gamma [Nitrosococcus oceani]|uniref:ATP synthase gamma chain n=2 Tax=Nitrosococcus oceani TaxID=1229 RepID=ATPG_NITOC|nr:F0F1 ATP synthase subunit gamma [Nitrosococcus oceani]Q3J6N0.1 RecName: Full=ATP synthase gamma chain; AltName: Full=ATP synthase F1 sector gamma subunit; AltName: Full=F-ATPase gamma subunit [Nitrosococcus oceani ATCC 19707]KFI18082.1 ATP F0F1 synthase subunit gamma [Nitrosococcus oceani C-27]ABA59516.1 ATP synthase F1 subcomplex gamma subunit [Nitrosococcus oceani ATCC 19707]EDZ66114.1 ATP synthase F1, gamma subunit [Nitrosococcus oceani AFC27]KFI21321.1 ATP F0F1 synthase subunit gamma [N